MHEGKQTQHGDAAKQQNGFGDLHPGGGEHAAQGDIQHHQHADDHHRDLVVDTEQNLHQRAGTHHLHHQIHHRRDQRRGGRQNADGLLIQACGQNIHEGIAAHGAQLVCHQKQKHHECHGR